MDIELSSDQILFRDATRKFLANETPLTRLREMRGGPVGFERGWWQRGAELGWTAMMSPPEYGGGSISAYGLDDARIVAEEMGRLVSPGPFTVTNVVMSALANAANAAAHAELIRRLTTGEAVGTWAFSEPGSGWDASAIRLRAERTSAGYRLTGVKNWVEAARDADIMLVTARDGDELRQFVVSTDAPGVTISPAASLDFVRRFDTVTFDGTDVAADSLVEPVATTDADLQRQLDVAVVLQCAETAGAVSRSFDFTLAWSFDRYSFGRPIASYQVLKHRFADMKMWLETCHATTTAAGRAVAEQAEGASELVSIAKVCVGQKSTDMLQDCVQIHGGIGVTWEHDLHLYLRRATVNRVTFGTPSEHRRRIADLIYI